MMLLAAALLAPLVGVTSGESTVLHRVDLDGLPLYNWAFAPVATARCGAGVKLVSVDALGISPVRWADLRTRGTGRVRCAACRQPKGKS